MSIDRCDVGRATVFALLIALGGGLTAQSAGQTTQQPPTQPTASGGAPPGEQALVDPVTGKPMSPTAAPARTGYPDGVMLKPDATGPAPGVAAGQPTPVRFSGKVGPGGKVIDQNAPSSPDGPAKVTDAAIERLGPGGTGGKAPTNERLGPGGTVDQTPASQPLGPGAPTSSQPAKKASPPAKPGSSRHRSPVAAETVRWRMSPSREVAFRCSSIRRPARSRSRPTLSCRSWISRIRQPMRRSDSLK